MKSGKIRIAVTAAAVVLIVVAGILFLRRDDAAGQIRKQMNLGQKYLAELNFEDAIVAFKKVIELDPRNAEGYLCLADAYVAAGEPEMAVEVLLSVPDDVDDKDAIAAKLEEIRALLAEPEEEETEETAAEAETTAAPQETKAAGRERNAYGAEVFEQRGSYDEFDSLPDANRSFVEDCIQAVLNKDAAGFQAQLDFLMTDDTIPNFVEDSKFYDLFTTWGDYKVQVYFSSHPDTNMEREMRELGLEPPEIGCTRSELRVELRPENGTGCYGRVTIVDGLTGAYSYNPEEMVVTSYDVGIDRNMSFGECNCENWQWNGEVRITGSGEQDYVYYMLDWDTEAPTYSSYVAETTGKMADGLRDGEFQYISTYDEYGTSTSVETYESGARLNEDGSRTPYVYGIYRSYNKDENGNLNQRNLNELYW